MPLDNSNGIMAQAMTPQPAAPSPGATPVPAASAPPAAAQPPAPPPQSSVPPDFFSSIGPQISQALAGVQQAESEPMPNAPPPLYQTPPPTPPVYNPIHAWGSTAMFLAGIGSLLTRTPLTAALNAASGVLNSYKANNDAQAQQAFEAWKTQSANALNLQKFELTQYTDAIKAHSDNLNDQTAALTALMTSMKDSAGLAALQTGGVPAVIDMLGKRTKAASDLADMSGNLETYAQEQQAWQQYQAAHPKPTDPKKIADWQIQAHAASQRIFKQSIADGTTDQSQMPDAAGFTPQQYLQMAQDVRNGGKPPVFYDGKLGDIQKHGYDEAMLALDSGGSGGGSGAAKPGALSPEALKTAGIMLARGVPMASIMSGMGTASTDIKAEIFNTAINYMISNGQDPTSIISAQADYKSKVGALTDLQKKAAQSQSYEQTVLDNMQIVQGLQSKVPSNIFPILNQIAQKGDVETGSPDVLAYGAALVSTLNEYAKVMSGGTGSAAASTDSARAEAQSLISRFSTGAQVNAVFAVMQQEMNNRITEFNNSISVLNNSLQSGAPVGQTAPDEAPSSAPSPSRGTTLHYDAQGNLVP